MGSSYSQAQSSSSNPDENAPALPSTPPPAYDPRARGSALNVDDLRHLAAWNQAIEQAERVATEQRAAKQRAWLEKQRTVREGYLKWQESSLTLVAQEYHRVQQESAIWREHVAREVAERQQSGSFTLVA